MSPILSSLDANDFQPIGEYIDRGEYRPNILDDGTLHARLEGDLNPEMLRFQVVRCGIIYKVAQMLEIPGLQDLAFRKLKILEDDDQALEILTVIELVFEVGSPEICEYLTQRVADHYWRLILAETDQMVEVMVANQDLAKGVFKKLSGQDGKIKLEEIVKEEGKEEVADGTKGGRKFDNPNKEGGLGGKHEEEVNETNSEAKGDDASKRRSLVEEDKDEASHQINKREKSDEAFKQTEEELVRTALRQSDKEQTEEDRVQLVQKQPDLFEAF